MALAIGCFYTYVWVYECLFVIKRHQLDQLDPDGIEREVVQKIERQTQTIYIQWQSKYPTPTQSNVGCLVLCLWFMIIFYETTRAKASPSPRHSVFGIGGQGEGLCEYSSQSQTQHSHSQKHRHRHSAAQLRINLTASIPIRALLTLISQTVRFCCHVCRAWWWWWYSYIAVAWSLRFASCKRWFYYHHFPTLPPSPTDQLISHTSRIYFVWVSGSKREYDLVYKCVCGLVLVCAFNWLLCALHINGFVWSVSLLCVWLPFLGWIEYML